MSEHYAISVNNLSKTYKEGWIFRKKFNALKSVSFDVPKGQIFGLLGPNGAGKTTFLKILLGVIRKSAGNATMLGHPAGSRAGRAKVGYLPERLRIPKHMTGYNALETFGNLSNVSNSEIKRKRDRLIELVGLTGRQRDKVKKYSKGMQQRLGLAQALLNDPELLVLDEPTDGLDPQARAEMRGIIRTLKEQGVTIFLNSHILQEVELICDTVAILDRGDMRYCGPVSEIGNFVKNASGLAKEGLQVEFVVGGEQAVVTREFMQVGGKAGSVSGHDTFTFSVSFNDQNGIDQFVDQLRRNNISIKGLNVDQVSLEDAFLKIVGGTRNEDIADKRHLMDNLNQPLKN